MRPIGKVFLRTAVQPMRLKPVRTAMNPVGMATKGLTLGTPLLQTQTQLVQRSWRMATLISQISTPNGTACLFTRPITHAQLLFTCSSQEATSVQPLVLYHNKMYNFHRWLVLPWRLWKRPNLPLAGLGVQAHCIADQLHQLSFLHDSC